MIVCHQGDQSHGALCRRQAETMGMCRLLPLGEASNNIVEAPELVQEFCKICKKNSMCSFFMPPPCLRVFVFWLFFGQRLVQIDALGVIHTWLVFGLAYV